MTQDRGRTFQLDAVDVDETNFALVAGNVMGEFQRTKVIPEIDAYRYSKIAELAKTMKKHLFTNLHRILFYKNYWMKLQ